MGGKWNCQKEQLFPKDTVLFSGGRVKTKASLIQWLCVFYTQEAKLNIVNGPFQDFRLEMGSEKSTLFSQNEWVVEYRCRRKQLACF
jgi:hypothetical protein